MANTAEIFLSLKAFTFSSRFVYKCPVSTPGIIHTPLGDTLYCPYSRLISVCILYTCFQKYLVCVSLELTERLLLAANYIASFQKYLCLSQRKDLPGPEEPPDYVGHNI